MKQGLILLLFTPLLFGCALAGANGDNGNKKDNSPKLSYEMSSDNYSEFFKIEDNNSYYRTSITPNFTKHFDYKNVIFNFNVTYSYLVYNATHTTYHSEQVNGTFNVTIDETGNGLFSHRDLAAELIGSTSTTFSFSVTLKSVSGAVSFKEEGRTIQKIEDLERDSLHDESLMLYYNFSGGSQYRIEFRADGSFNQSPNTDGFYVIDSVNIKFKATSNNVKKAFEFDVHPNLFGMANILIDDDMENSFSDREFKYTNGYFVSYN